MTIPTSLSRAAERAVQTPATAYSDPAALRARPKYQLRRYEVVTLANNGDITEVRHIAPALPVFEDAFCAFSRGTLIPTVSGHIAIEDLLPGDEILTAEGSSMPMIWKGSTQIVPGRPGPQGRNLRLTRIMSDAFGIQRPLSCIVAGHAARLLNTRPDMRAAHGGLRKLTPVQDYVDGASVIETAPPTAVELFHFCLPRHSTIRIGGLEFETYHPGPAARRLGNDTLRRLFLDMFPHVHDLCDFGALAHPRADEDEAQHGAQHGVQYGAGSGPSALTA